MEGDILQWMDKAERERERERETDRQTDRQTDRDRDRETETETERQRQREFTVATVPLMGTRCADVLRLIRVLLSSLEQS